MRENQIYSSTKYDDFVLRDANRDIDESHVKRIAESMTANGWQGSPIEVSERKTENSKSKMVSIVIWHPKKSAFLSALW